MRLRSSSCNWRRALETLLTSRTLRHLGAHPGERRAHSGEALKSNIIIPLDSNYRYFTQSSEPTDTALKVNPVYKFQHDRVQQAAYALIDEHRRRSVHLSIGRLMLKHTSETDQTMSA